MNTNNICYSLYDGTKCGVYVDDWGTLCNYVIYWRDGDMWQCRAMEYWGPTFSNSGYVCVSSFKTDSDSTVFDGDSEYQARPIIARDVIAAYCDSKF